MPPLGHSSSLLVAALQRDGYCTMPGVFSAGRVRQLLAGLQAAVAQRQEENDPAIRGGEGTVYAARNLLEVWPEADRTWRDSALADVLPEVLGESFGLVRLLFFDKPPGNSWALPWHKDLTIAVRDVGRLAAGPGSRFSKPTCKAGVPHVEAPVEVLEAMLTARIHLDAVSDENGPLRVAPGSHRTGKEMRLEEARVQTLHAEAGDVLLMRPLLAHCSSHSHPETARHRRLIHLEFAASPELPEGFAWYSFLPGRATGAAAAAASSSGAG